MFDTSPAQWSWLKICSVQALNAARSVYIGKNDMKSYGDWVHSPSLTIRAGDGGSLDEPGTYDWMHAYWTLGTKVMLVLTIALLTSLGSVETVVLHASLMHEDILLVQVVVQRSGSWFAENGVTQVVYSSMSVL